MYVKFKNKFKSISIITTTTLPISISDVVNQNSIKLTKNTKISDEFLKENDDKQFENTTNEKPFNQLVSLEQKLTPSDLDLLNTNPFNYFEKSD